MNTNLFFDVEDKIQKYVEREPLVTTPCLWLAGKAYWVNNNFERLIIKEGLSIKIKQEHIHSKIRLSDMYITNHNDCRKELKLIVMHQYAVASNDHFTFVSPTDKVIFHFANSQVFLVNGVASREKIQQSTVQPVWNVKTDNLWSCRENGHLKYQPMAKGLAASLYSIQLSIPACKTVKSSNWVIQGSAKDELLELNKAVLKKHTSISI
ncbi:hypothetical protein [Bacillus sp. T33-2]|uniref:hypothetical protein n=1 Tax=Bacillus sp. T33-2 TaxID=2054168 RepID=UPI000C759C87|nr:hypothetical protein [Bacillus sp. T33-2]PLR89488.1 hypothetical protein CVD19_23700 [Bacillus sp. T33-2]